MKIDLKYWPGTLEAIIILFFPICYILRVETLGVSSITTITIGYVLIITLILMAYFLQNRSELQIINNLNIVFIYIVFLIPVLLITTLNSNNLYFSSTRVILTILSMGFMLTIFYFISFIFIKKQKWRNFFQVSSIIFLILIIFGQIFIEDWKWGIVGLRFSGGTNPNTISFFVLYIMLQTHLNALISNKWRKIEILTWVLSLTVILWTFSRTSILMMFFVYFSYIFYLYFFKKSIFLKKRLLNILWLGPLSFIIIYYFIIKLINPTTDYLILINQRIFNEDNVLSRFNTWEYVINSFIQSPFIGSHGWWETKMILTENFNEGIAKSSHNLFIRLLTETGIIGILSILLLPVSICLLLLYYRKKIESYFSNSIAIFSTLIIISLFLGQTFEDRYLMSIFGLSDSIIVWFFSFALVILHMSTNKIEIK